MTPRQPRRRLTRTLLLASIGALLAASTACAPPSGGGTTSARGGEDGVLTVSQSVDASTLDPQKQGSMTDMSVLINIFDTLTTLDADGRPAPSLATEWEAVDDTTWRFRLRDGVTFHNGEPFNAAAVEFSIERLINPATRSPIVELSLVQDVVVVDDLTVDVVLSAPDPILPEKVSLFGGAIIPPGYVQEKGDDYVAEHPVGTGPFTFVEWSRGDRVTLAANPGYWDGAPQVQQLVFRRIPSPADALAAVRTGEVDIVSDIDPDIAAQLEGSTEAEVRATPGIRTYMLSLNTDAGGPLGDPRVRQALNMAVDVEGIIAALRGGYARRVATTVPEQSPAHAADVAPYPHDLAAARELLSQAGYPDGFATSMTVQNSDNVVAQALAGQLGEVGVQVEVNAIDPGTFEQELLSQDAGQLGPLFLLGNTPWTLTAWSSFAAFVPSEDQMSRFTNPQADAFWQVIETDQDPTRRQEAAAGMQQLLKEQSPFVYLYQIDNIYAVNPDVEWEPNAIGVLRMHDARI